MRLNTVHHVAFIVSGYEKSCNFHVNKSSFEITRENRRPERHGCKPDLKCGTIELGIFGNKLNDPDCVVSPKHVGQPEYHIEAYGLRHLAFYVNDADAHKAELEGMGIYVQPVHYDDYIGEKTTFFFDPDGLSLELHEQFSRG